MKIIKQQEFEMQEQQDMILENSTPLTYDTTELQEVFEKYFVTACQEIGAMIGMLDWRGGFDQIDDLWRYILEIDVTTEEGKREMFKAQALALKWSAADQYCSYLASKLQWRGPRWWYWCWEQHTSCRNQNEGEQQ